MTGCKGLLRRLLLALAVCVLAVSAGAAEPIMQGVEQQNSARVRVLEVFGDETVTHDFGGTEMSTRLVYFSARVLEGPYQGQEILVRQTFDEIGMLSAYPAKPGNQLFANISTDENGDLIGYAADYARDIPVLTLLGGFVLFVVLFGRSKGVKTVLALGLTCAAIFFIYIPLVLKGYSPAAVSIAVSLGIIAVTLFVVFGVRLKSIAAMLGCMGGIASAGLLAAFMERWMKITGLIDEHAAMLVYAADGLRLDLKGLVFSSIIIGALGATMDVAISIASSLCEIAEKAPGIAPRELVRSGINIGRDIMGTMANTLVLAYAGGSVHMILLLTAYQIPIMEILNRENIAVEILRSVAGSIGMLCAIPITAAVTAFFHSRPGGWPSWRRGGTKAPTAAPTASPAVRPLPESPENQSLPEG